MTVQIIWKSEGDLQMTSSGRVPLLPEVKWIES